MTTYWLLIENVILWQRKLFFLLPEWTPVTFENKIVAYEIKLFLFLFSLLLPNIFQRSDVNLKIKECWPYCICASITSVNTNTIHIFHFENGNFAQDFILHKNVYWSYELLFRFKFGKVFINNFYYVFKVSENLEK